MNEWIWKFNERKEEIKIKNEWMNEWMNEWVWKFNERKEEIKMKKWMNE